MKDLTPTVAQYQAAILHLRKLECQYAIPKIKLQCALKFIDPDRNLKSNPCDMVVESFGLMSNGTLLASPWAINAFGKPLSDAWVLGNLAEQPLVHLLDTPKAKNLLKHCDDNFGHCKIQAYMSKKVKSDSAMFEKIDPLYIAQREAYGVE